jgi:hypothetical protein
MSFVMGHSGAVVVGETTLCVRRWFAKDQTDTKDVTTTAAGGAQEVIGELSQIEFTIEADWDESVNPFSSPPNLQSGATVAIKLFVDASILPTFDMPTAFIETVDVDLSVEGVIRYSIAGVSDGNYLLSGSEYLSYETLLMEQYDKLSIDQYDSLTI